MILRERSAWLCLLLGLLVSSTLAWPWPPTLENIEGFIARRADESESASETVQPSKIGENPKATGSDDEPSATAKPGSGSGAVTSGPTKTGDSKASATDKKGQARITSVDPRLPAGAVNMLTPAPTDPTTYYKVSDYVTFAWNYTSLSIEPSKVDVYITNTRNQAVYTLANNSTYEPTGKVVWDTKKNANQTGDTPGLIVGDYTLVIHDASREVGDIAAAGNLGTFDSFRFGMYTPQAYTPLSDGWECAVCSGALSDLDRQALKFMFSMCIITVLSFSWFLGGFGILW